MWLIRPITFKRFGMINSEKLPNNLLGLSVGDNAAIKDQKNFKRKLLKNNSWFKPLNGKY